MSNWMMWTLSESKGTFRDCSGTISVMSSKPQISAHEQQPAMPQPWQQSEFISSIWLFSTSTVTQKSLSRT